MKLELPHYPMNLDFQDFIREAELYAKHSGTDIEFLGIQAAEYTSNIEILNLGLRMAADRITRADNNNTTYNFDSLQYERRIIMWMINNWKLTRKKRLRLYCRLLVVYIHLDYLLLQQKKAVYPNLIKAKLYNRSKEQE